jgi:hypothetical protein
MDPATAWPRDEAGDLEDMVRLNGSPRASITPAAAFSRYSRRRHIDLQRVTSCLCHS